MTMMTRYDGRRTIIPLNNWSSSGRRTSVVPAGCLLVMWTKNLLRLWMRDSVVIRRNFLIKDYASKLELLLEPSVERALTEETCELSQTG